MCYRLYKCHNARSKIRLILWCFKSHATVKFIQSSVACSPSITRNEVCAWCFVVQWSSKEFYKCIQTLYCWNFHGTTNRLARSFLTFLLEATNTLHFLIYCSWFCINFIQSVFEKFHYITQEPVRPSKSSAKSTKLAFLPVLDIVLQCDATKLLMDRE